MENDLKIIDNFFDEDILFKITDFIKNVKWICGCFERDYQNRWGAAAYWGIDLSDNEFFAITLKDIILKKLNCDYKLIRLKSLALTYGCDSTYHTDHANKNFLLYKNGQDMNSSQITFCYYINFINDKTIEDTDGCIYFKIPDKLHIICIETTNNRGVLFPGFFLHKPSPYDKSMVDLRLCITWKFKKNIDTIEECDNDL